MSGPGVGLWATAEATAPPADLTAIDREQAEAIHGEVDRLPRAFRLPVVLCYFEGLTLDEAARRLRCPSGTVGSRLARAREKLRLGLARRGVALPAAVVTAFLAPRFARASIPPLLCETTTRAATAFAARHAATGVLSASTSALAQEVLRTMLIHKLRLVAMTVLGLAAIATGAGFVTRSLAMKDDAVKKPIAPAASGAQRDGDRNRRTTKTDPAAAGRMTVTGRVLDPDGKPIKGAVVDVVARPRSPWVGASDEMDQHDLLGQGQSGSDGGFRLDAPRTTSTRVFEVTAIAAAPGYGLGWAELNPDAEQPAADLRLLPEQPVRVRLVDVTGAPAKGVEVRVLEVWRANDKGTYDNGVALSTSPPGGIRAWPRPLTTDDQGRIALSGFGRGVNISLRVSDLRYARQDRYVESVKLPAGKETTIALEPARIIEGRVLAGDTGQPIPNAIVSATTRVQNEHARGFFASKFRADNQGRFTMNPIAGESYTVGAFPTGGEPYLIQQDELKFSTAQVKATRDIKLRRGVLIRGKVTEQGTGRPLPASSIQFIPVRGRDSVLSGWEAIVASGADGSFQVAVPPGKGHLLIFGPTAGYILDEIGSNRLYYDRSGGQRYRAPAIIPYEVNAGDPPHQVAAALRPGVTIKGRVSGPDGQAVADALVLTTLHIEPFNPSWRGDLHVKARDGHFELHGLGPVASTHIYVLDPDHEWGATVEITGKQPGGELNIRLKPCGKALARFVAPDRRPVAKHQPHFEFVATPGPSWTSRNKKDQAELAADADLVAHFDRKHYSVASRTDAEGRFTMNSLIPGARYRIIDFSAINGESAQIQVRKEFTVKPGETLDLGDILIEKPDER